MDEAYGATLARRFLAIDPIELPNAQRLALNELGEWVASAIEQGGC
jgi:CRISPR system Cascade subunit CasC